MVKWSKIRFNKHAIEKFEFIRRYGFNLDEKQIVEAIRNQVKTDQKEKQYFASKVLDATYGLRVVY